MILLPRLCRQCAARPLRPYHSPGRRFLTSEHSPSILFLGSDSFSIASLNKLHQARQDNPALYNSLEIVTREPACKGRGLKETPTVVQEWAKEHNIKCATVAKEAWNTLLPLLSTTSLLVAVSFGLFIPRRILAQVESTINVHPSLLPQYRGPSPIHHAILNGDQYTGVSLQTLSHQGFDKGTIFAQSSPMAIEDKDTLTDLWSRLGEIGAEMLVKCIQNRTFLNPEPIPTFAQPSYAGFILPQIDWTATSGTKAIRMSRIFDPETGAISLDTGKRVPIHLRGIHARQQGAGRKNPGQFFVARYALTGDKRMVVVCDEGETVWVDQVKVSGRNWISGLEFANTAADRFWGGKFVPWRREFEDIDPNEFGYRAADASTAQDPMPS